MLLLVFAHRHFLCFVNDDVGSHQRWISKQTSINILRLLTRFFLKSRHAFQLAHVSIHVEQQVKFGGFGQVALYVKCRLLGIDARSQIFHQHLFHIAMKIGWGGVRGKGMVIGNKEKAAVGLLHF